MKKTTTLILLATLLFTSASYGAAAKDCQLSFVTKRQLKNHTELHQDIQGISKGIAKALKTSMEFVDKVDKYTLGLVSAMLRLDTLAVGDLSPKEWDKLKLNGVLLYQDSPLSVTPLRGTKLTIHYKDDKKNVVMTTGAQGEFNEFFYKIVSYKKFRLFPMPILSVHQKFVATAKVPLTLSIDSPFCQASMDISEIPFEPIVLFAGPKNEQHHSSL